MITYYIKLTFLSPSTCSFSVSLQMINPQLPRQQKHLQILSISKNTKRKAVKDLAYQSETTTVNRRVYHRVFLKVLRGKYEFRRVFFSFDYLV